MSLKEDAEKAALEALDLARQGPILDVSPARTSSIIATAIETVVKKYIHKTVFEMLGDNASDTAHFRAMAIVDKVIDRK